MTSSIPLRVLLTYAVYHIFSEKSRGFFYASLLLLLKTSTESVKGCLIALAIFAALFIAYTAFLVLSSRKKIDALKAHYCKEKS